MKGIVQYDGSTSEPFEIYCGMKHAFVLTLMEFGLFFAVLLKHAFGSVREEIYLHRRSDSRLFNLACLRTKTKVCKSIIRNMLFADDAEVGTHSQQDFQNVMYRFAQACTDFGWTISLENVNMLAQDHHQ